MHYIWCKFGIKIHHIEAETATSKGAIWNKFSKLHQHQSIKKYHILSVKISCRLYAHFSWGESAPKKNKGEKARLQKWGGVV